MPTLIQANPKYRKHKASGQAVVTLQGVDHYLGPHGTKASHSEYDRLIALWLANGRKLPQSASDVTIVELLAAFRRHALKHYQKDGRPTGEVRNFDDAIKPLRMLYGKELVRDFGPLKLKAIRALLVKGYTDTNGTTFSGLARGVVNSRIGRIKRIFKWAESEELAPASLSHALGTVVGLQRGRTDCRETVPVGPVDDRHVEATLPHLPTVVADMVKVQRLTGCRPGEVCAMRPIDIDRSMSPWRYRVAGHKMSHFGRERIIFVGPKAQSVLLPYLLRNPEARCFTPADSEKKRKAKLRANRKTPVQPSQMDRRKSRPKVQPTDHYVKDAYARAIRRGCDAADRQAHKYNPAILSKERIVPRWAPNQLRHAAATEIRRRFGLEAAQVCLGHSAANVTQLYAERDQALGVEVMRQIG